MENLYRLIYTSSRRPKCDEAEINNILNSCLENNPHKNISGILLHSEKRFVQYLEGDKDKIMELFEHIKKDTRHGGVNLRDYSPITEKKFPSWNMGYKDIKKNTSDFNTNINTEDRVIFEKLIQDKEDFNEKGIRILKLFFEMA